MPKLPFLGFRGNGSKTEASPPGTDSSPCFCNVGVGSRIPPSPQNRRPMPTQTRAAAVAGASQAEAEASPVQPCTLQLASAEKEVGATGGRKAASGRGKSSGGAGGSAAVKKATSKKSGQAGGQAGPSVAPRRKSGGASAAPRSSPRKRSAQDVDVEEVAAKKGKAVAPR